jgi:hypothetical protein
LKGLMMAVICFMTGTPGWLVGPEFTHGTST